MHKYIIVPTSEYNKYEYNKKNHCTSSIDLLSLQKGVIKPMCLITKYYNTKFT